MSVVASKAVESARRYTDRARSGMGAQPPARLPDERGCAFNLALMAASLADAGAGAGTLDANSSYFALGVVQGVLNALAVDMRLVSLRLKGTDAATIAAVAGTIRQAATRLGVVRRVRAARGAQATGVGRPARGRLDPAIGMFAAVLADSVGTRAGGAAAGRAAGAAPALTPVGVIESHILPGHAGSLFASTNLPMDLICGMLEGVVRNTRPASRPRPASCFIRGGSLAARSRAGAGTGCGPAWAWLPLPGTSAWLAGRPRSCRRPPSAGGGRRGCCRACAGARLRIASRWRALVGRLEAREGERVCARRRFAHFSSRQERSRLRTRTPTLLSSPRPARHTAARRASPCTHTSAYRPHPHPSK